MTEPMLPLPTSVLRRLATAETLRAELVGVTAERDTLREELRTVGWERDTAQNEASYMRSDILHRDGFRWANEEPKPRTLGLLLTSGDEPPPAPEGTAEDVALVSLSTGEVRVRAAHNPGQWNRYGERLSSSDFASLGESGPWVTIASWAYRDHVQRFEARDRLRNAISSSRPGLAPYPESAADAVAAMTTASERSGLYGREDDAAATCLGAQWSLLAAVRQAWEVADRQAARLRETLAATPHAPDFRVTLDGVRRCELCLVDEPDHLTVGPVDG